MSDTTLAVLRHVRERLADPARWCRKWYALSASGERVGWTSPEACQWCLAGALMVEAGMDAALICEVERRFKDASVSLGQGENYVIAQDRGHRVAMAIVDAAIAAQEARDTGERP